MFSRLKKKQQKNKKRPVPAERSVLRVQIFVGIAICIVISLIVAAIYFGTRVQSLQITDVSVVGGYTIPHSEVKRQVETFLRGEHFHLIPRTFAWTYPKRAIGIGLAEVPRLKDSEVTLQGQTLVVVFDEYQPVALWCAEDTVNCFFIDQTGFAFSVAPELTGSAFVRYEEKGKQVEVKTQAVERDFLDTSQDFVEKLADELGLYVTRIATVDELDVEYTVSGGGVLKTSRQIDLPKTFTNLRTLLQSEDFIHLDDGSFAYIDLRFGDKVFVNEELGGGQEKTASSSEETVGQN